MALYRYQALTKDGKKIRGQIDASGEQDVKAKLAQQGMFPISVKSAEGEISLWSSLTQRSVSTKDKILFTNQLSVLIKSGVPLLQALELMSEQFEGKLRTIIIETKDGVRQGQSFADGLQKYKKVFGNLYLQLVRAGEATGKLEVILDRLTQYLERTEEMNKRVKSAIRGPLIQLAVIGAATGVLMTVVVPKLVGQFQQGGKTLPAPTQVLMAISDFLQNHYLIFLFSIAFLVISYTLWARTPSGGRMIDTIKLKIPIVKFFARTGAIVRFCQTLGMLLESGVNLAEALDIVCNIIDNRVLTQALLEARDKIIKEGKITQYLKQTNVFPPIAIYLIRTGEESGKLDEMLLTVGRNYEIDLTDYADGLAAKINPLMMLVMAVVVGFILISVMMPMMQLGQALGG
jgi:type II secretory pathway component PulF